MTIVIVVFAQTQDAVRVHRRIKAMQKELSELKAMAEAGDA